ncbi:uncharacterized protein BXZ73DRAFT_80606 [Epithele typhae]|uniref:uncharacterized protein n=1 Tax=Epithele typhae TaxID=378194 RepID=UPI0020082436|nr:uncharacterized protein BXZ73DRAFT_80606 [Epithele typhae]KAH9918372.1 hypothetical protein BXZ73DRAFT_80606 [Epithele typhae]
MSCPIQTCRFTSEDHTRALGHSPNVASPGDILYLQETVQSPIFDFLIDSSEQKNISAAFTSELIGDIKHSYNAMVSSLEGKHIRSRPAIVHPRSQFSFAPNAVNTPPLVYLMTSFGHAEDLNKVKIPGILKYFSVPVYHPQMKDDPMREHIHLASLEEHLWDTSRVIVLPYFSQVTPDFPVRRDDQGNYRMPPKRFDKPELCRLQDISDARMALWLGRSPKKIHTDIKSIADSPSSKKWSTRKSAHGDASSTLSGDSGSLWTGRNSASCHFLAVSSVPKHRARISPLQAVAHDRHQSKVYGFYVVPSAQRSRWARTRTLSFTGLTGFHQAVKAILECHSGRRNG